jgi:hypothetical protein
MHYKMTLLLDDFNPPADARLYRVPLLSAYIKPHDTIVWQRVMQSCGSEWG